MAVSFCLAGVAPASAGEADCDTDRYQRLQHALVQNYSLVGACWKALDSYARLSSPTEAAWRSTTDCLMQKFATQGAGEKSHSAFWSERGYETPDDIAKFLQLWLDMAPDGLDIYVRDARDWVETRLSMASSYSCTFNDEDLCFSKIKLAYDNQVFAGGDFELDDAQCLKFKEDYDALYVRRSEGH